MSKQFSTSIIIVRRIALFLVGLVSFPFVAMAGVRAPFYSALHRQWIKRNDRPSWMQQAEQNSQFVLF
ncbi:MULTISPECIES: DUF2517 family protein [unclassified Agarivorans]|uniref:DUF2517 family protein n=1 Tax=unclassified Agarivorans TaxID=2636026 RepID=UPI0010D2ED8A|nr:MULTISPECIES: DUF2517 family protein [unclassified Agarivorans]MDO6686447.1 DUF2517 family protein [Agarivorans sp. 3_MG-2023]MDO6713749.1 DUF2517 family protein [Agarivorans sp. 2_MG-2023]MDO6762081.1 DUF2517 family protein [Agarivorans sp. 1_MG-2023]GDY25791.1 hypothetical protein AHAT_16810 [Agarivorans sp. Toyoura001]